MEGNFLKSHKIQNKNLHLDADLSENLSLKLL